MPMPKSELHYGTPFQLLVAVVLSAQCTDKRVNMVTPALFEAFPDASSLSSATFDEVYPYVKSISYPNSKTKHIIEAAKQIQSRFNGEVPDTRDELMTLPGVGQKTASVIASIVYDKPFIAVDTHVFRISHRLGLSSGTTPQAVCKDLEASIPAEKRADAHHWLILHGRYVCTARKPSCDKCGLTKWCKYFSEQKV